MNQGAFLLILLSVFLHAGWNFLSKANRPSIALFALVNLTITLLTLPFLFLVTVQWQNLGWQFWVLLAGSVFFEALHVAGLAGAYRKQDISVAYPLARALPVLMVAATTFIFGLGKVPGFWAWIGFAVVSAGCVLLPQTALNNLKWSSFIKSVSGFILLAAAGTTGYTVIDKIGTVRLSANAIGSDIAKAGIYLFLVGAFLSASLFVLTVFSSREKSELARCWKTPAPYLCGIFSGTAYFLVLIAMGLVNNVSFLQAFRQMSLPIGVIMGIIFLHEKLTLPKAVGTLLIVGGLIMSVFG